MGWPGAARAEGKMEGNPAWCWRNRANETKGGRSSGLIKSAPTLPSPPLRGAIAATCLDVLPASLWDGETRVRWRTHRVTAQPKKTHQQAEEKPKTDISDASSWPVLLHVSHMCMRVDHSKERAHYDGFMITWPVVTHYQTEESSPQTCFAHVIYCSC